VDGIEFGLVFLCRERGRLMSRCHGVGRSFMVIKRCLWVECDVRSDESDCGEGERTADDKDGKINR
jgi:hypothetical protein